MNKFPLTHLNSEDLLLYIDGEKSPPEHAAIQRHLASCWKCRSEVEDLESAISEFMRYKSRMDEARGSAGAHSSAELRGKMERLDLELGQAGLWSRVRKLVALPGPAYARRLAAGVLVMATGWAAVTLLEHAISAPKPQVPARQIAPALQPAAPVRAVVPAPPAPSPANAKTAPPPSPLLAGAPEVAALVKLHELGADLGEPVETVATAGGAVTVICRQVGRERESEIRSALAGIHGVTVTTEPAAPKTAGQLRRTTLAPGSTGNPLERALAGRLGGKAAFDRLANEVLDQDDALLARAYALDGIEERFPPGRRAELCPHDRAALALVIADHRRAARERGAAVESLLAPIAGALRPGNPPRRQSGASAILPAAQRVDRILNVIFGDSPGERTAAELGAELNAARAELSAALEAIR